MAIARGAGTEIIRCVSSEDVSNVNGNFIVGVQHHIYTVLSMTIYCRVLDTAGTYFTVLMSCYDSYAGTTGQNIRIFKCNPAVDETFVWNDKFSFNGYEPADFTTDGLTIAADQDKLADQGGSAAQSLFGAGTGAGDRYDISCTYIDQNNA